MDNNETLSSVALKGVVFNFVILPISKMASQNSHGDKSEILADKEIFVVIINIHRNNTPK